MKKKVCQDIEDVVRDDFNEVGRCFNCGSNELEYENCEIGTGYLFYPYFCLKCKHEGEESYNVEWVEQT